MEIGVPAHALKRSGIALPNYAGQASHVGGIGRPAGFFTQSSALNSHCAKLLKAETVEPGDP
jgi:hypothetical protein